MPEPKNDPGTLPSRRFTSMNWHGALAGLCRKRVRSSCQMWMPHLRAIASSRLDFVPFSPRVIGPAQPLRLPKHRRQNG